MTHSEKTKDLLSDFTTDASVLKLSGMALIVGAMSAGVAWVLVQLINFFTNLAFYQRFSTQTASPVGNTLGIWVIAIPVIGGLIIGLMARYGSEKIRGHGIPEALEAILIGRSKMSPKVAVLKPISSAISIGTGGPFGAEGPVIMTGGAFGSLFAQLFHLSSVERRILLAAGAAAGMAAIFAAPIAAVLLAIELLLFEWKPRSFIPVALAAAVASALRVPILGAGPIFPITPHAPLDIAGLAVAFAVGAIAGLASGALTYLVYGFEALFEKLPIHWMWWPAIGGFFVGLAGFFEPRVLGVGYDLIHGLLKGEIIGVALIGILIGKSLVWSLALGSGTSGGVLAPLLMIGGALGALESRIIPIGDAGLWAMISMAAMMGGAMRAPFAAMVFALEVTHDLNVLPGLLVGVMASQAVTVLMMRRSILTEKVARRGYHIAYEYSVDPIDNLRVEDVMDADVPTIPATMLVSELSDRIGQGDPTLARRQATPIVDAQGLLAGIITRGDVLKTLEPDSPDEITVLDAGTKQLIVTYPDEHLKVAVTKMLQGNVGRLPVVSREDARVLVGYLGRTGIMEARMRRLREEHERERSWAMPGMKS